MPDQPLTVGGIWVRIVATEDCAAGAGDKSDNINVDLRLSAFTKKLAAAIRLLPFGRCAVGNQDFFHGVAEQGA